MSCRRFLARPTGVATIALTLIATSCALDALTHTATAAESTADAVEAARALMQAQRYDEAVAAFAAIVEREPGHARAWYLLGFAQHARGAHAEAVRAYERALTLGAAPATTAYNLACAYALLGQPDEALRYLERAATEGFNDLATLEGDADLATVRDDPRFAAVRERVEALSRPCEADEFRRFDFWLGEWEVYQHGQLAGTNVITRISDGCALFESWTDVRGGTGHSINFYDRQEDRWKQTWVGGGAWVLEFVEADDDGYAGDMQLVATSHDAQGRPALTRMTFYDQPDGSVRQHMEQSTDGGDSWTTTFDGRYVRRSPDSATR